MFIYYSIGRDKYEKIILPIRIVSASDTLKRYLSNYSCLNGLKELSKIAILF